MSHKENKRHKVARSYSTFVNSQVRKGGLPPLVEWLKIKSGGQPPFLTLRLSVLTHACPSSSLDAEFKLPCCLTNDLECLLDVSARSAKVCYAGAQSKLSLNSGAGKISPAAALH